MVEEIKEKKRRKILVTGSSGMLGTALCERLSEEYDIVGLDIRLPSSNAHSNGDSLPPDTILPSKQAVPVEQCDIADKTKTVESIVRAKPDLVIHTAAWTDVDGCEKDPDKAKSINEGGAENVAFSASKLNILLIYISTDFVFDGRKKNAYGENDIPNPLNVYAKSKLFGEKKTLKLNNYIILRTSWLFGINGKNFVDTILNKAKQEKELRVVDDQVGSPTYAKDLAIAIDKLLQTFKGPVREIYHVTNKGTVSWFDYAREILKLAGITDVKVAPIKSKELKRPAKRPAFSALDNAKFEKATGFAMRPWQEALREYLGDNAKLKINTTYKN